MKKLLGTLLLVGSLAVTTISLTSSLDFTNVNRTGDNIKH